MKNDAPLLNGINQKINHRRWGNSASISGDAMVE